MSVAADTDKRSWWRGVTPYQWIVFLIAGGAWYFDNLDQRLFSLARIPALSDLMQLPSSDVEVQAFAKIVTALFLIGWGIGGLTIGALGDRFGRVRLMNWSVLIYALGTGATALAQTPEQFAVLRAFTGFGIGGVFGLAVAIIADNFSGAARVAMLTGLQIVSTIGNISAALTKMGVDGLSQGGLLASDDVWRWLFAIGTVPIVLVLASILLLKESDAWLHLKANGQLPKGWLGSYRELLGDAQQRRNLLIGTLLSMGGVVGLWAIGEFAVDLQDAVFTAHFAAIDPAGPIKAQVANAKNLAYLLQMLGGATGMVIFAWIANHFGRRPAFLIGFAAAFAVTMLVYWKLNSPADAYWMMPIMGAAQLSVFAGFSIYLPELFAAKSRGTGVSFCYNLGRFAAAAGGFVSAALSSQVYGALASPLPLRYSAMTMCAVFIVGFTAALFAPETRGAEMKD